MSGFWHRPFVPVHKNSMYHKELWVLILYISKTTAYSLPKPGTCNITDAYLAVYKTYQTCKWLHSKLSILNQVKRRRSVTRHRVCVHSFYLVVFLDGINRCIYADQINQSINPFCPSVCQFIFVYLIYLFFLHSKL